MSRKKNLCKTLRHPNGKKAKKPTDRLPLISITKNEKKLLKYIFLQNINKDPLNTRQFSDSINQRRQTVYDWYTSLRSKGLIEFPNNSKCLSVITIKGKKILESVGDHRMVCREPVEKSYIRNHKFTFKIKIIEKPAEWGDSVGILDSKGIQTTIQNFSKNNPLLHAKFSDIATVCFTHQHILIKPKNIYGDSNSEACFEAYAKTQQVLEQLIKLGFSLVNDKGVMPLYQTEGHYAEVNSVLAQFFEKTAKGFCVRDEKGKPMYWVDHSNGHLEDETSTEEQRENISTHLRDIMNNGELPKFSEVCEDLEKLKQITSDLVMKEWIKNQSTSLQPTTLERIDYCG